MAGVRDEQDNKSEMSAGYATLYGDMIRAAFQPDQGSLQDRQSSGSRGWRNCPVEAGGASGARTGIVHSGGISLLRRRTGCKLREKSRTIRTSLAALYGPC